MNINQNSNFGTHNTLTRLGKIKYIVVHYVGATGDAKANVEYYNRKNIKTSADFFVGHDGDIWQYNPSPESRYCQAVGGKKQSSYGGSLYGIATNSNCVSIEMCVKNSGSQASNSADWALTEKTYWSAVELARHLMNKYKIDADHVIRHFDVNGKACPGLVGWNTYPANNESKWLQFKKDVCGSGTPVLPASTYKIGDNVMVSSHYRGANDFIDKAVAVNPWLAMWITDVAEGARNPYRTNYGTYCNDGDIRGYAEKNASAATQEKPKSRFSQHVKDFQWACNQDGIRDDSGKKLAEDGIWGTKSNEAAGNVVLSINTSGRYRNLTSWVQCRVGANPNGIYDKSTESMVIAYQKAHGLTPDGKVGCMTLNQIIRDYT